MMARIMDVIHPITDHLNTMPSTTIHNDRRHEHAAAQPRKSLIFGVGVLEDLNDLLDGALLLLWLFFVCHRLPHLVMRLLTLER